MGNLCGSPSKDRDYEDHNGLDRKGIRADKLNKVSFLIQFLSDQMLLRARTFLKQKWRSSIANKKESSTPTPYRSKKPTRLMMKLRN